MPSRNDDNDDFDKLHLEAMKRQALKPDLPVKKDLPINQVSREDIALFVGNPTMDTYQILATRTAFYPGKAYPLGLMYVALKMNGEAGELAEHVGKSMRDDGYGHKTTILDPDRKRLLIKEGGDIFWYLAALCNELGIPMSEMAGTNLEKLADRFERDKLQGSGDER